MVNNWSIDDILKDSTSSDSDEEKPKEGQPNIDNINFKGLSTRRKYSIMAKMHGPIAHRKKMNQKPQDKEYDKKVVKQYVNALD